MRSLLRRLISPTILVSFFSFLGLVVGLVTQVVLATLFGAGKDVDAYLAASTLPQFVIAVLAGSLGFVFIPLFIEYQQAADSQTAWQVANTILNLSFVILAGCSLLGIIFAEPLLRLTVPGFSPTTLQLTIYLARFSWITTLTTGISTLLIGLYQSQQRFGWAAAVPVIGAFVTLAGTLLLFPFTGISSIAIASVVSGVIQVMLLLPVILRSGFYRIELNPRLDGVRRTAALLVPLLISTVFSRGAILIDRFVASNLPTGSIAYLGYANRIVTVLVTVLATGISVIGFVKMSEKTGVQDMDGLRTDIAVQLRLMWLFIAPAVILFSVLRISVISIMLERGHFSRADTLAVATILPWYLLAMIAMSLGGVISGGFYALKDTRTLAFVGIFDVVLYALYMPWLTRSLSYEGIAIGFACYWNISLAIMSISIWNKVGRVIDADFWLSMVKTTCAALWAGVLATIGSLFFADQQLFVLFIGFSIGIGSYIALLVVLRSEDALLMITKIKSLLQEITTMRGQYKITESS